MLLVRLLLHGSVPSAASLTMWEVTFHGLSTKVPTWTIEVLMETRNDKATARFNCTVLSAQRTRKPSSPEESRTPLDDRREDIRAHLEAHPSLITKAGRRLLALCQAAPGTFDYHCSGTQLSYADVKEFLAT